MSFARLINFFFKLHISTNLSASPSLVLHRRCSPWHDYQSVCQSPVIPVAFDDVKFQERHLLVKKWICNTLLATRVIDESRDTSVRIYATHLFLFLLNYIILPIEACSHRWCLITGVFRDTIAKFCRSPMNPVALEYSFTQLIYFFFPNYIFLPIWVRLYHWYPITGASDDVVTKFRRSPTTPVVFDTKFPKWHFLAKKWTLERTSKNSRSSKKSCTE